MRTIDHLKSFLTVSERYYTKASHWQSLQQLCKWNQYVLHRLESDEHRRKLSMNSFNLYWKKTFCKVDVRKMCHRHKVWGAIIKYILWKVQEVFPYWGCQSTDLPNKWCCTIIYYSQEIPSIIWFFSNSEGLSGLSDFLQNPPVSLTAMVITQTVVLGASVNDIFSFSETFGGKQKINKNAFQ